MKPHFWKPLLLATLAFALSTAPTLVAGPIDFTVSAPADGKTFTLSQ